MLGSRIVDFFSTLRGMIFLVILVLLWNLGLGLFDPDIIRSWYAMFQSEGPLKLFGWAISVPGMVCFALLFIASLAWYRSPKSRRVTESTRNLILVMTVVGIGSLLLQVVWRTLYIGWR